MAVVLIGQEKKGHFNQIKGKYQKTKHRTVKAQGALSVCNFFLSNQLKSIRD